jgi:hypothetical protein
MAFAKVSAERARKQAVEAVREAVRAEAHAWLLRMEGFGGPAQPSPTIAECLNGGWLAGGEVPSMRDQGQRLAGRDQATAQYANLDAGGLSEMLILPQGQVRPTGSSDAETLEITPYVWFIRTKNDRLAFIPRGTLANPQNPIYQ